MNIIYRLQGFEFEWDNQKAQQNIAKHGVAFEEAVEVFFDPFYQYGDATPPGVTDERRDFILGYASTQCLLLVVYTERRERNRIVSARRATRTERKQYESA